MKICVVIPSHSPSSYTKLTIASLMKEVSPSHELNIHVGVHSNYSHYTDDFSLFEELKGIAQIHCVDEIDWIANARNNYRYSLMHAKNLENLMKNVQYYEFDYLVILDNDVFIKDDFISKLTENRGDLIFSYFNKDVNTVHNERRPTGEYGATVQFMPRVKIWNVILSRKLFDNIMQDTSMIYPERISDRQRIAEYKKYIQNMDEDSDIVFDTFAKVNFNSLYMWEDIKMVEIEPGVIENMIDHFFCSSFNYGIGIIGNNEGKPFIDNLYKEKFPNGIIEKNKIEHFYQNLGQDWFTYPNLYSNAVNSSQTDSHFVEVGSWKGRSSAYMAVEIHNSNKNIKFDCVDTWKGSDVHIDPSSPFYDPILNEEDGLYIEFLKNIKPVSHIINPIRSTSVAASKIYNDESLDFVFIDGDHSYEAIKEDIIHWLPKVKKGGILSGHDYGKEIGLESIERAVHELFNINDIKEFEGCWIYEKN